MTNPTPNSAIKFPKTTVSDGTFVLFTPGNPGYVVLEGGGGSGTLPTSDAADGVVGAPTPADAILLGAKDPSGNLAAVNVDTNNQVLTSSLGLTLASTNQVTVTSTIGGTVISPAVAGQAGILITNAGAATIYLGASGVTTATGLPLGSGQSITIPTVSAVYGIVASTSVVAGYMSLTE